MEMNRVDPLDTVTRELIDDELDGIAEALTPRASRDLVPLI